MVVGRVWRNNADGEERKGNASSDWLATHQRRSDGNFYKINQNRSIELVLRDLSAPFVRRQECYTTVGNT